MLISILGVKTFQYQYITADILRYKEFIQEHTFFETFPRNTRGYQTLHWEINNHKESKKKTMSYISTYQTTHAQYRPIISADRYTCILIIFQLLSYKTRRLKASLRTWRGIPHVS